MSAKTAAETKQPTKPAKGGGGKHVYDVLKTEILSLDLKPGVPLDETSLAQRFTMSRAPIREALIRLSADGLVEMLSNRSTLVAPVNLADFPRYVEALDLNQRITSRLAAQHRQAADIERMREKAAAFDDACKNGGHLKMSATNKDFHMAVAEAGRNPYFSRSYGMLLDEGRRILHMLFDYIQESAEDELLGSEHHEMIDAIKARDVERADALAHAHTRGFHDRFRRFMGANYITDIELQVDYSE
ncbi:GntR family transcriptional regulator [Phaeobacter gallaeciensis]|uniref:GntR family transcriptional regulator n=1 Tax=Phaeobacter gallaeciensis TaxID=60890 RepID=UPI00237F2C24|nr:GntR family transcriptional regulator [Phaeobacter gallaeciensis]MDE4306336.1 GntR family transcriptional regulator [Phaeobacter gallaeciensis]MDE4310795.1 GntR family transcriptional regulator [Phaeobacter gallaeciensis]MDE4315257.1 GntR family transcriptional regulator [Phaeobacter gallaeciensis]MDE4319729.1 GntR family transcriptional regulator [Phaeobacter gallaeciensis]MDE4324186.1 GntR family transcriptional regulator [Phaeobacter gallaeciensis]